MGSMRSFDYLHNLYQAGTAKKEDNIRYLIIEIKELAKKRGLNVFAVTEGARYF